MGHFGKSWIENNVMIDSLKFCFYFFRLTKGKRKGWRKRKGERRKRRQEERRMWRFCLVPQSCGQAVMC